jgi:hypothetical protein
MHNIDNSNKPNIIGTTGEIFCIDEIKDKNNKYIPDDVIDLLCLIFKIKEKNNNFIRTKTLYINNQVLDWIEGKKYPKIINTITGNDRMNHVNKGTMGIRIGGSNNINITECKIFSLDNIGTQANIDTTYNNLDNPIVPYAGADTRGIIISNSSNIKIKKNIIKRLKSKNGCCEGICINDKNKYVEIDDLEVYKFNSEFIAPLILSYNIEDYKLNNIKVKKN